MYQKLLNIYFFKHRYHHKTIILLEQAVRYRTGGDRGMCMGWHGLSVADRGCAQWMTGITGRTGYVYMNWQGKHRGWQEKHRRGQGKTGNFQGFSEPVVLIPNMMIYVLWSEQILSPNKKQLRKYVQRKEYLWEINMPHEYKSTEVLLEKSSYL